VTRVVSAATFAAVGGTLRLPKTFHHPVVGDLTIAYEGLEMAAEPGLTLTIYAAGNRAVRGRIREALQASCQ
jgi:hypothetical protein